eukprot:TRINITY_DN14152_c2_g1_i1.p1 TRINITY_DN14152_c2_g1~~TRINITY_DN14152_c2_g1_i1.p1  ORF type:complete len:827 (+),score=220.58 TRINITY_DN14152_c2_g1_i1:119-2482(+)
MSAAAGGCFSGCERWAKRPSKAREAPGDAVEGDRKEGERTATEEQLRRRVRELEEEQAAPSHGDLISTLRDVRQKLAVHSDRLAAGEATGLSPSSYVDNSAAQAAAASAAAEARAAAAAEAEAAAASAVAEAEAAHLRQVGELEAARRQLERYAADLEQRLQALESAPAPESQEELTTGAAAAEAAQLASKLEAAERAADELRLELDRERARGLELQALAESSAAAAEAAAQQVSSAPEFEQASASMTLERLAEEHRRRAEEAEARSAHLERTLQNVADEHAQVIAERDAHERRSRELEDHFASQVEQQQLYIVGLEAERDTLSMKLGEQEERHSALVADRLAEETALRDRDAKAEISKRCAEEREAVRDALTREFEAEYTLIRQQVTRAEEEARGHQRVVDSHIQRADSLAQERDALLAQLSLKDQQTDELLQQTQAHFQQRLTQLEQERMQLEAERRDLAPSEAHRELERHVQLLEHRLQQSEADRAHALTELKAHQLEVDALRQQADDVAVTQQAHREQIQINQALERELHSAKSRAEECSQQAAAHRHAHSLSQEENEMLKKQMANTWAQINSQMARLDEERSRYLEEVRHVAGSNGGAHDPGVQVPETSPLGSASQQSYFASFPPNSTPSRPQVHQPLTGAETDIFGNVRDAYGYMEAAGTPPHSRVFAATLPPSTSTLPPPTSSGGILRGQPVRSPQTEQPQWRSVPASQASSPLALRSSIPATTGNLRPVLAGAPAIPQRRYPGDALAAPQPSVQVRPLGANRVTTMPPSSVPTLRSGMW